MAPTRATVQMKFNGQSLSCSFTQVFTLPRPTGDPLVLRLSPLPLGFHQQLRRRGIHPPSAPVKIARDSNGKILRDSSGHAITQSEYSNPDYLSDIELYHQRVAVLSIVESLRNDDQLTFETPVPSTDANWPHFADAIFAEMEAAGLSTGDLIRICNEVCRISNLIDSHLQESQANFSCTAPPNST
ncbi:MAG: hypothetical protein KDA36_09280 [Planctomycetaceae bacterium]|nr:hypothetical protein [Planctomycetaceae bacterium]MCA9098567.1 hypothetical protein [Planctomycetaceae bacterium]